MFHQLTRRQKEIIELLSQGYNASDIASFLCISCYTVRRHLSCIYDRLGVRTQVQLVALYLNNNGKAPENASHSTNKQYPLSKREEEVWLLYKQGLVSKQIGEALYIRFYSSGVS